MYNPLVRAGSLTGKNYMKKLLLALVILVPFVIKAQKVAVPVSQKADSVKAGSLFKTGETYAINNDKRAPEFLNQVIKICEGKTATYFVIMQGESFVRMGTFYLYTGNHDKAASYYNRLMQSGIEKKNDKFIAQANLGFGNIADYKSDYETSISKNLLALRYFEGVRDSLGIAAASGNIGNSYIRVKQYQKAVTMLNTAIDIYLKKGPTRRAANNISSLARAYGGLGNKQKELELKLKAFNLFTAEGYKKGIATVSINLGVYYSNENKTDEAMKYYNIALKNSWQINDNGNIATLYNNMAGLYIKLNKPDAAMLCTDSAWYYSQKSGDRLAQTDALYNRTILLHMQGKHVEADNYSDRYTTLKDSIYATKMQSRVADMEVQYETEKKEGQIKLLSSENKNKSLQLANSVLEVNKKQLQLAQQKQVLTINKLELNNKEQSINSLKKQSRIQKLEISNSGLKIKQKNYAIVIILILFMVSVLSAYFLYAQHRSKQLALMQQQKIAQQEHLTQAIIDAEEKERKRIASDLHDGVGQMFSAVKMNLNGLLDRIKIDREEDRFLAEKTIALVDESCKEVRVISHQMMPNMLLRSGIASDVKSFIEKIDSERLKVNVEAIGFKNKLESNVEIVLYRVIQETVNNVIKHAKATLLDIKLVRDKESISAVITDNGVGFNAALKDDFEGIGLKNIATRIEYLKGTVNYISAPGAGTSVNIWVPVA